jgi:predicted ATPase
MRIVVSGTHASGKSTLIADFADRHPDYLVLPDPYELIDERWDAPGPAMFAAQLQLSAARTRVLAVGADVIAERGPLDFLAYLIALDDAPSDAEVLARATALTRAALAAVDLLVVVPLAAGIVAGEDEHPRLRRAMDAALLDLVDDGEAIGDHPAVLEVAGDRAARLHALERAVAAGG